MNQNMNQSFINNIAPLVGDKALQKLKEIGVPTSKQEEWRYSSLASFLPTLELKSASKVENFDLSRFDDLFPHRLVLLGGKIQNDQNSLPQGISAQEVAVEMSGKGFIEVLSESISTHTIKLKVDSKLNLGGPLAIIHLPTTDVSAVNIEITFDKDSQLEIIELKLTEEAGLAAWNNSKVACDINANSHIRYVKLTSSNENDLNLNSFTADLKRDANLITTFINLGGKLTRQDVVINLKEEGANGTIRSLAALKGEEQADLSALIYHAKPNTFSTQLVKNILDDKSRGVFTGKIYIEKEAIGVDSSQLSRALLLSKKAQMNARPQLEIYADDVKAGHGATIGQLSDEELFYLQSRGLDSDKARQMLCHGFALEILDEVKSDAAKTLIADFISNQFEKKSQGFGSEA